MLAEVVMAGPFGRRLRELRDKAGLSQDALARAIGMSWSTIAKLETLDQDPKWSTVQALAVALGVSVEAFVASPEESEKPTGPPPAPKKPAKRKPKK